MLIEGVKEEIENFEKRLAQEFEELPMEELPMEELPMDTPGEIPIEHTPESYSPDIPPPGAPTTRGPMPAPTREQIPISLELPEIAKDMSEVDIGALINLVKLYLQAIKNSDSLTLSYVTTMLKKLFEKYQQKHLTTPFFTVYSFFNKLESLKKFQDKNGILNASANKLASILREMEAFPVSSRVLTTETYDFEKVARSGRVTWSVDFIHRYSPRRRSTIKVGVTVNNMEAIVDNVFYDIKGNRRPFDKVSLASYAKGEVLGNY